ncbi:MAG: hypothetical protein ACK559_36355, partial [bacterium]
ADGVLVAGHRDDGAGRGGERGVGGGDGLQAVFNVHRERIERSRRRHEDVAGSRVQHLGVHELPLRPVGCGNAQVPRKAAVDGLATGGACTGIDRRQKLLLGRAETLTVAICAAGGHI